MKIRDIILKELRKNSRTSINTIVKRFRMPTAAAYTQFRHIKKCIKKFVTLMDFQKMGYGTRAAFFINSPNPKGIDMRPVNTMAKLRGKHRLMMDCYFRNDEEASMYERKLKKYAPKTYYIVEELSCEEFLTK